jgi:hypothetical protein
MLSNAELIALTPPTFKNCSHNIDLFPTTMGLSVSSLFSSLSSLVRWSKDEDVRILMLGLDSAGKVR